MSINDFDQELYDNVMELVGRRELDPDSAAYGIARHVMDRGYSSLSPKQRYVYDREVGSLIGALLEEHRMTEIMNGAHD